MNEPRLPPLLQRLKDCKEIKSARILIKSAFAPVLAEIISLFAKRKKHRVYCAVSDDPGVVIALICTQIEQLAPAVAATAAQRAEATCLQELNMRLKEEYVDHFADHLPHIQNLPDDVYHCIELIPGATFTPSKGYDFPKKYRNAWNSLIKDHLSNGRI
ncbi:hypothetical protein H0H87_001045 [Tephrocybe sp. NHM501043]|nr:hypothetical protein H0H87_002462 [Tephrocybe sp. NHM501043]KAG6839343.1 hypothetical protein H0H87_001045 [Tephrocybe sp. NHM501043]